MVFVLCSYWQTFFGQDRSSNLAPVSLFISTYVVQGTLSILRNLQNRMKTEVKTVFLPTLFSMKSLSPFFLGFKELVLKKKKIKI